MADVSGGVQGAAGGAATGFTLGGPPGAVVGGALGGLAGLFGGGSKGKVKKLATKTKEQQQLLKLIQEGLATGEGPFADIFGEFNEEEFNKGVRDPALKNFKENILPVVQEKFIANNQTGGSAARRGQQRAGLEHQSALDQLMYQAQQQQKQNRIGGVNTALGTNTFENLYIPGSEGAGPGIVSGASK